MAKIFKLALAQLSVSANKKQNLDRAVAAIAEAAINGAAIVALPECFNCPYGTKHFPEYAEAIPGESSDALKQAAQDNKVYVVGGSIPERDGDNIYNTCAIFDPRGNLIGKHRKVHLFDIDIPGKITFQESETLSPGQKGTVVETEYGKLGIGICYDIRFPGLAQSYAKQDCQLLLYPGAFNMTTGPMHWELLQRARAVDNQLYVAAVSPARDETADYHAWGHSTVVDPWGKVAATTDEKEGMLYCDIDFTQVEEVRTNIPIRMQKQDHVYK